MDEENGGEHGNEAAHPAIFAGLLWGLLDWRSPILRTHAYAGHPTGPGQVPSSGRRRAREAGVEGLMGVLW